MWFHQRDPTQQGAVGGWGLTVKWPSWWSGKWMKRYSVATSCMMESPRNSILWLCPLDKEAETEGETGDRDRQNLV